MAEPTQTVGFVYVEKEERIKLYPDKNETTVDRQFLVLRKSYG
jgi:ubiquinone biosynthesis protein Coq4